MQSPLPPEQIPTTFGSREPKRIALKVSGKSAESLRSSSSRPPFGAAAATPISEPWKSKHFEITLSPNAFASSALLPIFGCASSGRWLE